MTDLKFYISRFNSANTSEVEIVTQRDDEGAGIWISLTPQAKQMVGSIKIEVHEGRLFAFLWGQGSDEDHYTVVELADNYETFLKQVKQAEAEEAEAEAGGDG